MPVTKRRTGIAAAALVAVALVALLWLIDSPAGSADPMPAPASPAATAPLASPSTRAAPVARPLVRARWWRPGQPHDYGTDVDPFIRQPQDYGSDTPAILGERISFHVYDLERVQDMVRRGTEPHSEIAQVRGTPLTEDEREAARRVLQAFFDQTVPDVDAIIEGSMSRDEGYDRIRPRRLALDRDLRDALGLTDKQLYELWPHLRDRDDIGDRLRD